MEPFLKPLKRATVRILLAGSKNGSQFRSRFWSYFFILFGITSLFFFAQKQAQNFQNTISFLSASQGGNNDKNETMKQNVGTNTRKRQKLSISSKFAVRENKFNQEVPIWVCLIFSFKKTQVRPAGSRAAVTVRVSEHLFFFFFCFVRQFLWILSRLSSFFSVLAFLLSLSVCCLLRLSEFPLWFSFSADFNSFVLVCSCSFHPRF